MLTQLEVRAEVEKFDPTVPIERARTPPASWYSARALYDLERQAVFAKRWQLAARRDQVAEPGNYVTGQSLGEPWVLVRGPDGVLRALANVCRHKGREVVTKCGHAERLVCGYHAWSYHLDGTLASAPRIAGIEDFDKETMALPRYAVTEWGPWVFVNLDRKAPPLVNHLTELDRRLAASSWEDLRYVADAQWNVHANWKVVVDNYLDGGYHIPHMHPSLAAQLDMDTYRTEVFALYSIQSSGSSSSAAGARVGNQALYAWIYPNIMVNRYGPCLDVNHVVPLSEDRCRIDYAFYFLDTVREDGALVERSIEQSAIIQREDVEICESVQRGLTSSTYDRGRYAPRVELGEHHFHRLLAADYAAACSSAPWALLDPCWITNARLRIQYPGQGGACT